MLQEKIESLFEAQMNEWPQASGNYADLKKIRLKRFEFESEVVGKYDVFLQFNPARMISTTAKIDAQSLAARKCFLCEENRPKEQRWVEWRDYDVLVNPFPIFDRHFVIAKKVHTLQNVLDNIGDMIEVSAQLPDYAVFYNGPKAGASAPDHHHFQACRKESLPIVKDMRMIENGTSMGRTSIGEADYLRTVELMYGRNVETLRLMFEDYVSGLNNSEADEEPMMNVVCLYEEGLYKVIVLPRSMYRPRQYGEEGILISPGTVEMCGVLITPMEQHFEKVTRDDVVDILGQVTYSNI